MLDQKTVTTTKTEYQKLLKGSITKDLKKRKASKYWQKAVIGRFETEKKREIYILIEASKK